MVLTRLLVVMVVLMAGLVHAKGPNYATLQALRAKLLENYDKHTLPLTGEGPITVNISGFNIRNLYMDEMKHQVNLHLWITYTWQDIRLSWDPAEYSDASKLYMNPDAVWMPDLTVYNSGDAANTPLTVSKALILVYPDGKILQVPPIDTLYNCVADLTYWPHDKHTCSVVIGSWVHDGYTVDLHLSKDLKPELEVTKEPEGEEDTMQWKIDPSSNIIREEKYYQCCSEPYYSMKVNLILVRDAPAYAWLIVTPAVCFTLLSLVIFMLPPDAGVKITFGGVCLLLHLVFLVFANCTINSAPTHTPLIVQLVVVEVVLVTASVVVAAMVVRVANTPSTSPPPSFLTSFALKFSSVLFISPYAKEADELELEEKVGGEKMERQKVASAQWVLLGAFYDRVAFLICLVVTIVVLGLFSVVI